MHMASPMCDMFLSLISWPEIMTYYQSIESLFSYSLCLPTEGEGGILFLVQILSVFGFSMTLSCVQDISLTIGQIGLKFADI